jgi:replicative superfamily II helicase
VDEIAVAAAAAGAMGEKKKWNQDSVQTPQATETLNGSLAPRSYQLEVLEKAKQENTIVYLETGTGKTLIATMLLQSIAHRIRKPSRNIAVFLGPTVCLIQQQGGEIEKFTDLKVGMFWGDMNADTWKCETWQDALNKYEARPLPTPDTPLSLDCSLQPDHFSKV